jgi:hypothetical protein
MSHTETTEAVQPSPSTELEAILSKMKGWSCETGEYSSEWVYSADDVQEALTQLNANRTAEMEAMVREIINYLDFVAPNAVTLKGSSALKDARDHIAETIAQAHGLKIN